MKTMREYLQSADRERILGCLGYSILSDPIALLEQRDKTVDEIEKGYRTYMNDFIDRLLALENREPSRLVFYLADGSHGKQLCLSDLDRGRTC